MEQMLLECMESVQSVDGKEKLEPKLVESVADAELLAARLKGHTNPKLMKLAYLALGNEDSAVWIWGERSFAIAEIWDTVLKGRIASAMWIENEPGFAAKKYLPVMEKWAKANGAHRVLTYVYREGPWERLTGWKPWALVIAKEL